MTHELTGALVAAPTTSLPEDIGGVAQLGLPLLLAARLGAHARGAAGGRLHRRGPRVPRLRLPRRVGRPRGACRSCTASGASGASPSSSCRTCPATRARAPVRIGNAASEQFQLDVFGEVIGAGYAVLEHARPGDRPALRPALAGADRPGRARLARARRRHLGGARAAAPLHPLQGDGVGGLRPGGALRRAARAGRPDRALGGASATRSTPRSASAPGTRTGAPSPSTTARPSSTPPCC